MKKTILNLSLISILTILFSSCGSISITQKRYSNGLNIDWFAGKDKKADNQKVVKKRKAKSNPSELIATNYEPKTTENSDLTEGKLTENHYLLSKLVENKQTSNTTTLKNKDIKKTLKSIKKDIKSLKNDKKSESAKIENNNSQKPNQTNEVPLILLVILALFPILSLIAVYLHQGEINTHFWITLILHFIFLYWLYALLVVLDII